jgi:ABC-type proline/glycine betaine transport system substrate-binding protein
LEEVLLKQAPLVVLLWEPTTVLVKVPLVVLSQGPAAIVGKVLSTLTKQSTFQVQCVPSGLQHLAFD